MPDFILREAEKGNRSYMCVNYITYFMQDIIIIIKINSVLQKVFQRKNRFLIMLVLFLIAVRLV